MRSRMTKALAASLFLLFIYGCGHSDQSDLIITDFGTYAIEDGMVLNVADDEGIVSYSVSSDTGETIIEADHRASVYQRWILVWDGSRLWFSSSDIGGFVWIADSGGDFSPVSLMQLSDDIKGSIPSALLQFEQR